ncbi:zf-HC2 domain-containing protein [uncultured Nocardioides sp.]|uniref:zf-HC2 domain-containing protein n=1 Tax=uncultured Nocardioides sp. TaxID=198441 RepID=UPI002603E365|nr:zf-HC2 domain-containing protein [uncultured Nocardioides sp.]
MIRTARRMLTCHWSARRLQRYLDADPAAPLTSREVARLEEHLATCERCADVLGEHRLLSRALGGWRRGTPVDHASVRRVRALVEDLAEGRER